MPLFPRRFAPVAAIALIASSLAVTEALAMQQPGAKPDTTPARTPATLAKVTVSDSARRRTSYAVRRTSSATRTDVLLRDVPQSATVISRTLISDQAMQGMADVVRYVPGITMGQGEGHRDAPTIRGQSTTADFFIDGIRDDAQYYRDVYNVDRVEALKGPNAMTFGRGGGGGVINRVTKDAQWTSTRSLSLTGGSFDQRRSALDVGQGLTTHLATRLNALYENSATFRQQSGGERIGINPTASLLLGATMVHVGYEFYSDRRVVDRGIPSYLGAPSPTPIETFFGDPDQSRSRLEAQSVSASIDHQLWRGTEHVSPLQLRNRSRVMTYDKFYQNVFPGAVNGALASVNLQGYNNGTDRRNLFNQTDLTTTVTRGALRQTLLLGAEFASQRSDNVRNTAYFGAAGSTATSFAVPFTAPAVSTPVSFRYGATDANSRTTFTTQAVYAQNQVEVGSHVQGILGLRLDHLTLDYHNNRNDQRLSRTDVLASPRAGLVIKPVVALSIYGSLGVSYLPGSGDQFGSLTATTQTLEPEQFTNREVGIKWDARQDLALTAAVYRLDRTNTTAPDPVLAGVVVQTGAQRTTGWEIGASGSPTAKWQIAGGYVNQVARIMSRTSAAAAGARVPLVPRWTLSLWNRYQIVPRAGVGVGIVQSAKMFAAIDNTVILPAFTRVDGAAFLTLTKALRAQVNVENVFDTRYYATSQGNNNIMPGSSRLVRVSMNVVP
ncbi:MAG: TonB-dependent siderophore receptor [Gemmatimonadaceae bacterium]|nr:TonB-dependent siderophore receptor [Gemmatimonadaceae bacterium]